MDICPESLGAMLGYWHIERGLLANQSRAESAVLKPFHTKPQT